jgi:hypothetical protein
VYGRIHLFLGPAIVLGGIINGFTGFNFSGEPRNNIYWGIAVAVILVVVLGLLGCKRWSTRKQKKTARIASDEHHVDGAYPMN